MNVSDKLIVMESHEDCRGNPQDIVKDPLLSKPTLGKNNMNLLEVEKLMIMEMSKLYGCILRSLQGRNCSANCANGAGKTSTLRSISRIINIKSVALDGLGKNTKPPAYRFRGWVSPMPEGRNCL